MSARFGSLVPAAVLRRLSKAYSLGLTFLDSPAAAKSMLVADGLRRHRFRRLLHPFAFRPTVADRDVVMQNIVRGECVGGKMPRSAGFIVDAGGYIGDTAAVFLSRYPSATCLVYEPSSNSELAATNLRPYGSRAVVKQAMIAREHGRYGIVEIGTGSKVFPADGVGSTLRVETMDEVLRQAPEGRIDVLKLDIEGAEHEILRPPTPWLSSVGCVVIELHGAAAHRDIPGWLRAAGFALARHRSMLFCNRPAP
jgi:FkbM family methyltransferase